MTLNDVFQRHRHLRFPDFPEDDALGDWMADLAEFDGHVAGIVFTILDNDAADTTPLQQDVHEFRVRLEAIQGLSEDDRIVHSECLQYLESIEAVVAELGNQSPQEGDESNENE